MTVAGLRWLTPLTFEVRFHRPEGFDFRPGQKISVFHKAVYRDYSLVGAVDDDELVICVRLVKDGRLTPVLARSREGDRYQITPAFGHFLFQSRNRPAVLIATGTGVAPFVAYARDGVTGFGIEIRNGRRPG